MSMAASNLQGDNTRPASPSGSLESPFTLEVAGLPVALRVLEIEGLQVGRRRKAFDERPKSWLAKLLPDALLWDVGIDPDGA